MALEKYHFEASDGTRLELPYLNDKLSFKQAKKIRKQHGDDVEALTDAFLNAALTKEDRETVENLSLRDFNTFFAEWTETEVKTMGE